MLTFNNKILTVSNKGLEVAAGPTPPPGPVLPAYTLRLRFADGVTPTNSYGTLTQVSSSPNVWDWTYNNPDWQDAWFSDTTLLEVIAGNTSDVTNMRSMFNNCSSLTAVPLLDTSNVTNMRQMFQSCFKVESGALALYQQASSQANPPSEHSNTFIYCGRDTQTGAAELAQIPSSWGGTAS